MVNVLVIEDNKDTARMVKKILEPRGHIVQVAANGLDGLQLARTFNPQVILVDMDLPDLEGKVIVNQLRAEASFEKTAIAAFTAENSSRAKRLAMMFGCNDFISKPIDTRTFPDLIERLAKGEFGTPSSAPNTVSASRS
jgi:DNA-binding response OmpR family regulator